MEITCTKCGEVLDPKRDLDWGRKNHPDTLGFYVNCDTCKKPQRLCEDCWNNTDDCNECEEMAEAFSLAMSHDNNTCPCRCGHARTCRDCGFYGAEGKEQ